MTGTEKALGARVDKAAWEYDMFQSGDRVLMAVSGGADSMSLLHILARRLRIYAHDLKMFAVYVELGFGDQQSRRRETMEAFFAKTGIPGQVLQTTAGPYSHSDANRENPCFLCSRIRRKHIFAAAESSGCNKIVLGHHKDDLVETFLLNMIFSREISTSPPKLRVLNGKFHLLRPLLFAEESLVKAYARELAIPVFSQECPTDGSSRRQYVKDLLQKLEQDLPGSRENLFFSMKRVKPDYLL